MIHKLLHRVYNEESLSEHRTAVPRIAILNLVHVPVQLDVVPHHADCAKVACLNFDEAQAEEGGSGLRMAVELLVSSKALSSILQHVDVVLLGNRDVVGDIVNNTV